METTDLAGKYKNVVFNLAIVLISVFISLKIYGSVSKNISDLNSKKEEEINKNQILSEINQLENKFSSYKKFINSNKEPTSIINALGLIAKESAIKIVSIRPAAEEDFPLYIKYPFDLTVEADSYHDLARFVSRLESDNSIYIIESSRISLADTATEEGNVALRQDLKISTISVKN